MNNRISVFIPVKNGAQFIEETILSLQMQSFKDWQLVIKDNCSTDNTEKIVQKYLTDSRISWVARSQDIGMIENYNSCLVNIQTKYYVIFSHDDCILNPEAFKKAYSILESNEDIPKVHCDMLFIDNNSKKITKRKFKRSGRVFSDDIAVRSIISIRNLYGIPLLIRTSAIKGLSYDSALGTTADIDFSIVMGKGQDIYHIPEPLIGLRIHKNNLTHGAYFNIYNELKRCAKKNRILLSGYDTWKMKVNNFSQIIQKYLFFIYLRYIR